MARVEPRPEDTTREHLLNVAEALFLERGPDEVSLRMIVRESGQKNQSALQYYFGSRDGLIDAILDRRLEQIDARRGALVEMALAGDPDPELRQICALMIRAPFLLCREDRSFRDFLGLMGQRLLASDQDLNTADDAEREPNLMHMRALLRGKLRHVDPEVLKLRIENAYAFTVLAISRRARRRESFRGRQAELFFDNLADQLAAMLGAAVSDATRAQLEGHGQARELEGVASSGGR
ncbi:MAG: helix-turn-helix domain-containing protein [Pseudomonadales bacterium]